MDLGDKSITFFPPKKNNPKKPSNATQQQINTNTKVATYTNHKIAT